MNCRIIQGDCIEVMKTLPEQSVNCCVTSPPYFGLRDYGCDGQIGLEETPEQYIEKMVEVFRQVRRVLRDDGTLWLNLGDSYSGNCSRASNNGRAGYGTEREGTFAKTNLPSKNLIGIPWRVAFALQADGWYLRQDIIWHKPNPMPESVKDRCTKSHEYIFLLTKSARYWYDADAIKEPIKDSSVARLIQDIENQEGSGRVPGKTNGKMKAVKPHGITRDRLLDYNSKENQLRPDTQRGGYENEHDLPESPIDRNKRSVWTVCTQPYKGAHFAVFPPKLIEPCILAGCPTGGTVLDPFGGSGTTGMVAENLGRNSILIELNPEYIKIEKQRTAQIGMEL